VFGNDRTAAWRFSLSDAPTRTHSPHRAQLHLPVFLSTQVCMDDFVKAKEKALYRKKGNVPEGLYL
jgi:hypothetical protein